MADKTAKKRTTAIGEEEGGMFRIARGVFSRDELQARGARMRELWHGSGAVEFAKS